MMLMISLGRSVSCSTAGVRMKDKVRSVGLMFARENVRLDDCCCHSIYTNGLLVAELDAGGYDIHLPVDCRVRSDEK